jgi:hypothetical protein
MAIMPFLWSRCEAILNVKIRRQELPNHKEAIDDILGGFAAFFVAAYRSFYLGYIRRERARRKIHVEILARDNPDDDRTDEDVLTTISSDILSRGLRFCIARMRSSKKRWTERGWAIST